MLEFDEGQSTGLVGCASILRCSFPAVIFLFVLFVAGSTFQSGPTPPSGYLCRSDVKKTSVPVAELFIACRPKRAAGDCGAIGTHFLHKPNLCPSLRVWTSNWRNDAFCFVGPVLLRPLCTFCARLEGCCVLALTPCSLVEMYHRFRGDCSLHLQVAVDQTTHH